MIWRSALLAALAAAVAGLGWVRTRAERRLPADLVDVGPLGLADRDARVLAFFGHVECRSCPGTLELVREAVKRAPEVVLRTVEYAEEPHLFAAFEIDAVPTMLLCTPQGRVLWARAGHPDLGELAAALAMRDP